MYSSLTATSDMRTRSRSITVDIGHKAPYALYHATKSGHTDSGERTYAAVHGSLVHEYTRTKKLYGDNTGIISKIREKLI